MLKIWISVFQKGAITASAKIFLAPIFAVSIACLAAAFAIEHIGHIKPCAFCIYERWPYVLAAFFTFLGFFCPSRNLAALILMACAGLFFVGLCVTVYHVAIEHHWVDLPKVCGDIAHAPLDFSALKDEILHKAVVPCDRVPMRILGVSLAEINVVLSLVLSLWSALASLKLFGTARS